MTQLIGFVIVTALLAVGFGCAAFMDARNNQNGWVWDSGFLLSVLSFLVLFVRILLVKAAATLSDRADAPAPMGGRAVRNNRARHTARPHPLPLRRDSLAAHARTKPHSHRR